jgi:hypothetical protein
LVTPLLNVQINDKKFVIASDNYRSVFAWLLWDFWFHPMCHQVYFHSNNHTEWYLHNLVTKLAPISFIHLKLLKKTKGLLNYHANGHTYLKNYYASKCFSRLNKQYIDLLHTFWIYENR